MEQDSQIPTPPPENGSYSRVSPSQAAADAIPLLVDDTYHLFHLTTPSYTRHHPPRLRSSWWRLRSKNLVNWTRDPEPSITPSADRSSPDADGAWTGAAVLGPDGIMNVFYTGYNLLRGGKQVILRSKSGDKHGTQFSLPGQEISFTGDGRSMLEDIDFRDPYVFFNEQDGRYWMLIASRLASGPHWSRGCVALLKSEDLETWTFEPEPLYQPNDMFCPECPELFTLPNKKWYLVYSRFHGPNAGTVYRVADSPTGPFRIPRDGSHGRLDGRRWYAAKSCPKSRDPSKRIFFGWAGDYVGEEGKWLWGGDLGIPRELSADVNGNLRVEPVLEVKWLFEETTVPYSHVIPAELSLSSTGKMTVEPNFFPDEDRDLLLHFAVPSCDAHSFGLMLDMDVDQLAHRLRFQPDEHGTFTVMLDSGFPPLDDFWADQYSLHLPRSVDGPEMIRHDCVDLSGGASIFLRGKLIEVFLGGRSMTFRLPQGHPASRSKQDPQHSTKRLAWFVEDGRVDIKHLTLEVGGRIAKIEQ
ncbi:hypothetical protein B9Z65_7942 [Elsinoe australis]|uniref:beta-fructofuranosidase n=1 Tax=Elsinoe australis TaxID=40998 RepID=A0A2P8A115_9PEZI|nr:hypothetical protein B9Z65_7942 [Elsinoe australis]